VGTIGKATKGQYGGMMRKRGMMRNRGMMRKRETANRVGMSGSIQDLFWKWWKERNGKRSEICFIEL
jgi:hypothetical protein